MAPADNNNIIDGGTAGLAEEGAAGGAWQVCGEKNSGVKTFSLLFFPSLLESFQKEKKKRV